MINILETVESTDICVCLIRIFIFMGEILNILKIVVPIIIVLIGSIDLIKAVVSNSVDEDMKKASQKLLKRFILGVCVFFVTAIVQLILSLAGSKMDNRCFNCVVDVNGNKCNKEKIDKCKRYGTTQPKDKSKPLKDYTNKEYREDCKVMISGIFITKPDFENFDQTEYFNPSDTTSPIFPYKKKSYHGTSLVDAGTYTEDNINTFFPDVMLTSFDSIAVKENTVIDIYSLDGKLVKRLFGPTILWNKQGHSSRMKTDGKIPKKMKKEDYNQDLDYYLKNVNNLQISDFYLDLDPDYIKTNITFDVFCK